MELNVLLDVSSSTPGEPCGEEFVIWVEITIFAQRQPVAAWNARRQFLTWAPAYSTPIRTVSPNGALRRQAVTQSTG